LLIEGLADARHEAEVRRLTAPEVRRHEAEVAKITRADDKKRESLAERLEEIERARSPEVEELLFAGVDRKKLAEELREATAAAAYEASIGVITSGALARLDRAQALAERLRVKPLSMKGWRPQRSKLTPDDIAKLAEQMDDARRTKAA
jgi:hypothetical protein